MSVLFYKVAKRADRDYRPRRKSRISLLAGLLAGAAALPPLYFGLRSGKAAFRIYKGLPMGERLSFSGKAFAGGVKYPFSLMRHGRSARETLRAAEQSAKGGVWEALSPKQDKAIRSLLFPGRPAWSLPDYVAMSPEELARQLNTLNVRTRDMAGLAGLGGATGLAGGVVRNSYKYRAERSGKR